MGQSFFKVITEKSDLYKREISFQLLTKTSIFCDTVKWKALTESSTRFRWHPFQRSRARGCKLRADAQSRGIHSWADAWRRILCVV